MKPRVLFYDDAPQFGGHELMSLRLVEQLLLRGRYEVGFIASAANHELVARLDAMAPAVRRTPTPYASGRGQWLRTYLSLPALLSLVRRLRRERPDLLIVVQGGVALSSLAVLAGRLAGVRTCSYLPMTHDESMFASSPAMAVVRQWAVRLFYALPQCLVTISPRMAALAARRRRGPVRVVENGIRLPPHDEAQRDAMRGALGLQPGDQLLLMIGRIEFWQKRHDLAVQALALARARGARLHLLVVGQGPDEAALRAQVRSLALADAVHWQPWQSEVTSFYAACDALLLPSRYEGVPLVMLEAMYLGRPVIAADVDGMADLLPSDWLFPSGAVEGLADRLEAVPTMQDPLLLQRHHELIAERYTLAAFGQRFEHVIDDQLEAAHA